MERRMEADFSGGQSSSRAATPRGRKEGRKEALYGEAYRSRNNSVRIAIGYWLDDRGVGFRVPIRLRIFTS
jgi:hypothetical protein